MMMVLDIAMVEMLLEDDSPSMLLLSPIFISFLDSRAHLQTSLASQQF